MTNGGDLDLDYLRKSVDATNKLGAHLNSIHVVIWDSWSMLTLLGACGPKVVLGGAGYRNPLDVWAFHYNI